MTDNGAAPEFSMEIDITALPASGKHYRLKADKDACARIAKRLNIPDVKFLDGEISISATKKTLTARGVVRALVVRECVASLEAMDEDIKDAFEIEFLRNESDAPPLDGREEWELPEIHEGDIFDIGELLVQQLSLAMTPFPRKEGAKSLAEEFGAQGESSPFAILQAESKKSE